VVVNPVSMFNQAAEGLVRAAQAALGDDALAAGVQSLYRTAEAAIAVRQPICHPCARCCQFERYGHNLFVSTAEVAFFLQTRSVARVCMPLEGTCPFLRTGQARCSARSARPLGCRLYFCDRTCQTWQQDLYRVLHRRLQDLHLKMGVPYFYAEWLQVLGVVAQAGRT
jgi:hypothetical protein